MFFKFTTVFTVALAMVSSTLATPAPQLGGLPIGGCLLQKGEPCLAAAGSNLPLLCCTTGSVCTPTIAGILGTCS
ncbi:hypothetical protein K474DRAFT_1655808 [Panus rudis PR-1116 ss-1]|nr:hypothetical protein K474DRAFT_1655808 [Panus rudis PR-1116 ss-1]